MQPWRPPGWLAVGGSLTPAPPSAPHVPVTCRAVGAALPGDVDGVGARLHAVRPLAAHRAISLQGGRGTWQGPWARAGRLKPQTDGFKPQIEGAKAHGAGELPGTTATSSLVSRGKGWVSREPGWRRGRGSTLEAGGSRRGTWLRCLNLFPSQSWSPHAPHAQGCRGRGQGWGRVGGVKQSRFSFTWQMHNSQGSPGDQICPTGNSTPLSSTKQPGGGTDTRVGTGTPTGMRAPSPPASPCTWVVLPAPKPHDYAPKRPSHPRAPQHAAPPAPPARRDPRAGSPEGRGGSLQVKQHCPGRRCRWCWGQSSAGQGAKEHSTSPPCRDGDTSRTGSVLGPPVLPAASLHPTGHQTKAGPPGRLLWGPQTHPADAGGAVVLVQAEAGSVHVRAAAEAALCWGGERR